MATGTVRQIIEFKGQDDASAVADKVKKSVQSLGAAGEKASKATASIDGKGIKEIQEKSGDVESALKGISDFAGDAKGQVSQLGDSFGAVEGIMRLLPGPIGLATTAVAGLAIGAKLLADYISQSAAKAQLLTTGLGSALSDKLNLGAEGAVKLSAALNDLGNAGLRPSELLLQQVADNARALGADPADNVAKFIQAWKEGPEAIAKVEQEIGKLGETTKTLGQLATGLGLDAIALGFEKAIAPADELRASLSDAGRLTKEITALDQQRLALAGESRILSSSEYVDFLKKSAELERQIGYSKKQLEFRERDAKLAADRIGAEQVLTELEAARSRGVQIANIRAQLANDKQAAQKVRLESLATQQAEIESTIAQILRLQGIFGDKFAAGKLEALNLSKLQLDVQKKQINDADAAEKKAAASAAAARAKAARDARLRAGEKYEAEEVAYFADKEKTSKELSFAAIRANIKALEDQAQAEQRLVEARIGGTEDPAVKARLEIADLEARKLRELDAVRNDVTINEETRKAKLTAITVETTTKTVAIQTAADARVKASADEVAKSQREAASAALTIVGTAAQAAQAYAGPNGLAGAMAQAATSAQTLINGWKSTESNTAGVIGAVGSVAAAVVDGERTKAGILAITEAAQAVALAFVPGKQAEAAGHAASALLYGGIASGLLGGSSAAAAPAAAPGFGAAAQTQGQGGAPAAVGTTVINFNAPLATRYEIGKSVAEANKAAMLSGNASAKGA